MAEGVRNHVTTAYIDSGGDRVCSAPAIGLLRLALQSWVGSRKGEVTQVGTGSDSATDSITQHV